jgi:hypothetical protein
MPDGRQDLYHDGSLRPAARLCRRIRFARVNFSNWRRKLRATASDSGFARSPMNVLSIAFVPACGRGFGASAMSVKKVFSWLSTRKGSSKVENMCRYRSERIYRTAVRQNAS